MIKKIIFFIFLFFCDMQLACASEWIAYSHLTDGYWQIWAMDSEGKNKKQITYSKQDKRDPTWLERGQKIAFRTNNGQLFLVTVNGSHEEEILAEYKNISNPHFCDLTQEVVFVRFDPQSKDMGQIWKAHLNSRETALLTREKRLQYQPTFSYSGKKITFVRSDEERKNHQIWIMDGEGNNSVALTNTPGLHVLPSFSPDDQSIVFSSDQNSGNYDIYFMNIGTKKMQQITKHPGLDTSPCFSSDGKSIVFVSNRGGKQEIWKMGIDGNQLIQLTQGESESIDPAWGSTGEN